MLCTLGARGVLRAAARRGLAAPRPRAAPLRSHQLARRAVMSSLADEGGFTEEEEEDWRRRAEGEERQYRSIVKVFATTSPPNYLMPWQVRAAPQRSQQ